MLYQSYEFQNDVVAPLRAAADNVRSIVAPPGWFGQDAFRQRLDAGLEMLSRFKLTHDRPSFGVDTVFSGGAERQVTEKVALSLPFGNLIHFSKDIDAEQPKVLIVAPLSGHFATLLRGTVQTMLQDHDVYITDWINARDVSVDAGAFGVEDHVDYLIRFMEEIGPGGHMLAVCQPCVQALAAVAVMAEDRNPAKPRSMTLMAGPIDVRESPTEVNGLARKKPLSWFKRNLIANVPGRYAGAGRRVYPGFVQLFSFMSMNMERHSAAHQRLYNHLAAGELAEAEKIKSFYNEYFAVLDLTAEFYLETVDRVFQRPLLALGEFTYQGRVVDPGAIRHAALLTVEGGRDDICGLGQTTIAHDLCRSLRPHLKRHHLQANVGHYGVFNGRRWEKEIYPVVRNTILSVH